MGEEVKAIVPESVLKKQKREEEWALKKKEEFNAAKKKRVESRKLIYSRQSNMQRNTRSRSNGNKVEERFNHLSVVNNFKSIFSIFINI
ncbi:hypothetical protein HN873_066374 [Arachis hypogaea]